MSYQPMERTDLEVMKEACKSDQYIDFQWIRRDGYEIEQNKKRMVSYKAKRYALERFGAV